MPDGFCTEKLTTPETDRPKKDRLLVEKSRGKGQGLIVVGGYNIAGSERRGRQWEQAAVGGLGRKPVSAGVGTHGEN